MFDFEGVKPPRVNPEHLITFYFVAERKSLSQASDLLFLSQPTVCLHIKALERGFGVKLVHVKKKRVIVTEAGEALLPYAKELYQQAKSAEMCLQTFREEVLRIGVALTLSSTIITVAGKFRELFPNTKVKIKEGPSYKIVEETSDLQHDLAVVARLNYGNPKLEAIGVSEGEKMIFIASTSDPLSREDELEFTDLNGCPLILPAEKSATREVLLQKLEEQQVKPVVIAEVDNPECVKSLVRMGKGVALVLETSVEDELPRGKLKVLPFKEDIRIGVDILVHRDNPLRSMGNRFVSLVRETYENPLLAKVLSSL